MCILFSFRFRPLWLLTVHLFSSHTSTSISSDYRRKVGEGPSPDRKGRDPLIRTNILIETGYFTPPSSKSRSKQETTQMKKETVALVVPSLSDGTNSPMVWFYSVVLFICRIAFSQKQENSMTL